MSHPYIPFRTSPLKQSILHHELTFDKDPTKSRLVNYDPLTATADDRCPLQFSLGISKRVHHTNSKGLGILNPPVIFPIIPSKGPGRQVLYATQYEHLDMMTPSSSSLLSSQKQKQQPFATTTTKDKIIKEALVQHAEFPMLFESSAFLTSPVLRDVNNDGILDAILTDYDGGIYALGMQPSPENNKRYFHKAQVPRLYVRRHWMESLINETLGLDLTAAADDDDGNYDVPTDREGEEEKAAKKEEGTHDPYHSYFEYTYGSSHEHEQVLRGVTASVLGLDKKHVESLKERRGRKVLHKINNKPEEETEESEEGEEAQEEAFEEGDNVDSSHRRLQEVEDNQENPETGDGEGMAEEERKAAAEQLENAMLSEEQEVIATDTAGFGRGNEPDPEQLEEISWEAGEAAERELEGGNQRIPDEVYYDKQQQQEEEAGDDEYSYRSGDDMNYGR
jgi:hypothetical protein